MATKRIVHLRVYKGGELNYDRNGKVKNPNQLVKLPHGSKEWTNYLTHLGANGFCSVEVEKVLNEKGNTVKTFADISTEVKNASSVEIEEQPKSEAQIENEKLRSQIEDLKGNKNNDSGNEDLTHYSLAGLEAKFPTIAKMGLTTAESFIEKINEINDN